MIAFILVAQTVVRATWIVLFADWVTEILILKRDREYLVRTGHIWQCRLFGICVVAIFAATFSPMAIPALGGLTYLALAAGGMSLFLLGAALHINSRLYLGKNWSSEARVRPGHRLVTRGPYTLVRHPVYLSEIMMAIATAVVFENWLVLLLSLLLIWTAIYQARIEERLLQKQFRVEIETYRQSTPMLLPTIKSFRAGIRELFKGRKR